MVIRAGTRADAAAVGQQAVDRRSHHRLSTVLAAARHSSLERGRLAEDQWCEDKDREDGVLYYSTD